MSFSGSFCFKKMPFLQSIVKSLRKVGDNFLSGLLGLGGSFKGG
ncbi:hypothetical protein HMPREF1411_00702 [Helicobacter pylori GAM250AFi]|nr:hypothetical protein HMPREF1411_00702 [Helicobacter pylori GAM250AFi]EMH15124.1 hypothetical protein HMPREF1412_00355 [Helicobacter pylori GAM250T]EMH47894.1 hypothetical protein HMPREF1438_00928 [Helicobacter pylori HP250AFii]EMH48304.1 hypothetical protein HMPREF1439_00652 [Helicobacter pylori HP250AFiii]EMH52318.1 hypothetical protein HMPREF1440_00699 [Helicobacter pylori HP250AFiV]EMH52751.1 hypothetical protein HMPREF1442_00753 [Helicobacter pylori HP250ASii]EMH56529.1 hypothetical pr